MSTPTLEDVARLAGVSTATVSRVINNKGQIAADTARRVRDAIGELNYRPHAAARGLASGRTHTIGLIALEVTSSFLSHTLAGIESGAREAGMDLLIYTTRDEPPTGEGFGRPLGPHNTDGILVFTDILTPTELRYLHQMGFPVVLLHQSPPEGTDIPSVAFENKVSACRLVDHLIEQHGCQRIAYLGGRTSQEDSMWREAGYRESLAAHGLPFDPAIVKLGGFKAEEAVAVVQQWLDQQADFDAIFAFDDETAVAAIYALHRAGRCVPEDVAVVGFDDSHSPYYLGPPITTVRAPIEQAGLEGVRQLLRLIDGDSPDPLTLLSTELIIRRSCGCN